MKIVKIGGSLLAPKHTNELDIAYCTRFFTRRNAFQEDKILIHGVGNVGHGFVKTHGLTPETYLLGRVLLDRMFSFIDKHIHATRVRVEEIPYFSATTTGSWIIGGDIRPDLTISSGDIQFPEIMHTTQANEGYMLTNVPGVLDATHTCIPLITKEILPTIAFRHVENDVTGGMKGKIYELFERLTHPCVIWIVDGNDLDNVQSIMRTGSGVGTKIVIE